MSDQRGETARSRDLGRESMLRIANQWQARGQVNQARDAFLRILARYPNTPEARQAADQLMAQAQHCERRGQLRLALSLYQRLEENQ